MYQQFRSIITNLPLKSTIYLSNFTPLDLFEEAFQKGFTIKLLPSTLEGLIDTRALKVFDPEENATIIAWPFFHNNRHDDTLRKLQKSYCFTLYTITPTPLYECKEIQELFMKQLHTSPDLDMGAITTSHECIIYLRPHMFCPKEGIIDALKEEGVKCHTNILPLCKHKAFQSQRSLHTPAHECYLSFIALDCSISKEEALQSSQALLKALQKESIRRCSF